MAERVPAFLGEISREGPGRDVASYAESPAPNGAATRPAGRGGRRPSCHGWPQRRVSVREQRVNSCESDPGA
jgi:hypothetical protein